MLLATDAGLGTCAQEAWATKADTVASFVQAPAEQMLFCGVAIGYPDKHAAVNSLVSDRESLTSFATFLD
jgi:nitroreductase